jgi:ATP-binding cassette subfamily F protein 3
VVTKSRQPRKDEKSARKELKALEKTIALLDDRRRALNAQMMATTNAAEALKLHTEIEAISSQLAPAEERWLELQEDLGDA